MKLRTLIKTTRAEFRGRTSRRSLRERGTCVSTCRSGVCSEVLKAFRDADKAGKDDTGWETFKKTIPGAAGGVEEKWHAWVKTLKWG